MALEPAPALGGTGRFQHPSPCKSAHGRTCMNPPDSPLLPAYSLCRGYAKAGIAAVKVGWARLKL